MRLATATILMALALPQAAIGRDGEIPPDPSGTSRDPDPRRNVPVPIYALMSANDRGHLRSARLQAYGGEIGPLDLTLMASRAKGGRPEFSPQAGPADRFKAQTAGLALSSDIGGGLTIRSEAYLASISRPFDVVPNGIRPRATGIGMLGIEMAQDQGAVLKLGYVRIGPRGRRPPLERMTELAGGAPLAGRGLQLALTGGEYRTERGGWEWRLSAASMRRPGSEAALESSNRSVTDNRAEFSLRMAF